MLLGKMLVGCSARLRHIETFVSFFSADNMMDGVVGLSDLETFVSIINL
jgi:hypothetical protein